MSYPAHDQFVAPARARAELWRFILGMCVAGAIYVGLALAYFRIASVLFGADRIDVFSGGSSTPLGVIVMLLSFGLMSVSGFVVVRVLHRRSIMSLFGEFGPMLAQFRAVLLLLVLLGAVVFLLPPWEMGGPLAANLPFGLWAMLLPISLLAVLVQVSAEEIIFRGYVQQQLAARFSSPLVWMVLPSALFAVGHYTPANAGENAFLIALWAGVFGILMADLTARSGTLGPAIAVHFFNNVWAMVLISMPDELSGLALYVLPFGLEDVQAVRMWLPVDFALMFVSWLVARLAIRR